ncbi:MAG: adenylyltransferase/cytidyltransferase family protein [Alphaproteobacteria bacterium]|nr:adenylyltransferase/cytidyltransferase family protein [Alphaproteobacteria bacterium]
MLQGAFNRKIHTASELATLLGGFPRKKRVVMCHGTFDIVHPGHIRHLLYARDKGDVLVVSLTCDEHILKANYRPHVPEDLRAMNLAALEMVDHVIIDRNATPIENIRLIQPDFFVKGYEYGAGPLPPRTQEEKDAVESYGGEIIFTPGDVVFSSSAIIESRLPNLAVEKLALLMRAENVTFADLRRTLSDVAGTKVHVVGDTIVDTLTHTELIGANAKTPTFSVRYAGKTDFVGGAGIVAKHLRAAGANVAFTTVLGDDSLKDFVLDDLKKAGIAVSAVIDRTRPTTNKNAFVADGYRLLKVDNVDNRSISDRVLSRMVESIQRTTVDAAVFSDFRHGIFNRGTIPTLIEAIPNGVFRVADSQVASRWGNILDFRDFDLITPNEREARFALADQDSVVRPLGSRLYSDARCKVLMLKMGARGLMTFRGHVELPSTRAEFFVLDSFVDAVVDAVGTGDALLAYATLALQETGNSVIASILGAVAAAVECEFDGNVPVTPEAMLAKLGALESRAEL